MDQRRARGGGGGRGRARSAERGSGAMLDRGGRAARSEAAGEAGRGGLGGEKAAALRARAPHVGRKFRGLTDAERTATRPAKSADSEAPIRRAGEALKPVKSPSEACGGRGVEAERVSRGRARWGRRRRCAGRGGGPERPAARRGAARARAGGTRIPRRGSPRRAAPAPCIAASAPAPGPRGRPGPEAGGGRGGRGRPGRADAPWWPCARRARRRRAWARSSRGCRPSWWTLRDARRQREVRREVDGAGGGGDGCG